MSEPERRKMSLEDAKAIVQVKQKIEALDRALHLARDSSMFYEAVYSHENRETFQAIAKALGVSPNAVGQHVAASLIRLIEDQIDKHAKSLEGMLK